MDATARLQLPGLQRGRDAGVRGHADKRIGERLQVRRPGGVRSCGSARRRFHARREDRAGREDAAARATNGAHQPFAVRGDAVGCIREGGIAAGSAGDDVAPTAAHDQVVAGASGQVVVARLAENLVVRAAPIYAVAAGTRPDRVGTLRASDGVPRRRSVQDARVRGGG